jgi:hypothetical protein
MEYILLEAYITKVYYSLDTKRGGETDEVGTDTEAGTGSSRNGKAGDIGIQNAEGGSSSKSNECDLLKGQTALGDSISCDGNHNTLDQILNGSLDEFT